MNYWHSNNFANVKDLEASSENFYSFSVLRHRGPHYLSISPCIISDGSPVCSVETAGLRSYVSSEKQLVCADWQLIALWFNLVRDFQKCCVHSDLEIGAPRSLCVQNFNAPKKKRGTKGPPGDVIPLSASRPTLRERGGGPGQDILWPSLPWHPPTWPQCFTLWPHRKHEPTRRCGAQDRNLSWTLTQKIQNIFDLWQPKKQSCKMMIIDH